MDPIIFFCWTKMENVKKSNHQLVIQSINSRRTFEMANHWPKEKKQVCLSVYLIVCLFVCVQITQLNSRYVIRPTNDRIDNNNNDDKQSIVIYCGNTHHHHHHWFSLLFIKKIQKRIFFFCHCHCQGKKWFFSFNHFYHNHIIDILKPCFF